jgi:hypothetical protein
MPRTSVILKSAEDLLRDLVQQLMFINHNLVKLQKEISHQTGVLAGLTADLEKIEKAIKYLGAP